MASEKYYTHSRRGRRRLVAVCPKTGKYLHHSCTELTDNRDYAWSTWKWSVAECMQETFPLGGDMVIMEDPR